MQTYLLTQPEKSLKEITEGSNFYSSLWLRQGLAAPWILPPQKIVLKYQLPCSKQPVLPTATISEDAYKPNCKVEISREMAQGHIAHSHQLTKVKSNSLRRMMTFKFFQKSLFNRGTGSSPHLDWQSLAWNQDRCCLEGSPREAVRYYGLSAPWPLAWTPLLCFELL